MSNSESSDSDKGDDKPPGAGRKIQRSVDSMLKQMKMSNEEIKYRMENFDNVEIGKEYKKYLKCTKCNKNFQHIINKGEKVGIHPLLGVLMCDSCCDYYGDGYFSLDSEGEDKYCRWCGEGGTIFACSKCICGFCNACIEKHFGAAGLEAVENDDDWVCYFCNPKPLWCLRSICFLAKEAAKNKKELLIKKKERGNVKKKRRKKENVEDGLNNTSSDSNRSSSSSSNKFHKKRKRLLRHKENRRVESSSSEDEKENHLDSKKRLRKSRTPILDKEKPAECDPKNSVKKSEIICDKSEFGNTKSLVLEKLKSIWKLTQTISEVGLNSSRERLKSLSKPYNFKTLELLKKEHEKLKTCMNILVSSLNSASNSADSIKEDLTFDTTKDEREIFQSEETKLKRFAEKCQEESNIQSSVDSDSSQKEFEMKKNKEKRSAKRKENSMRDSVKVDNKKRERDVSSDKESMEGKNKSISLCGDSESEEKIEKQSADKNEKNCESGKESCAVKPLLKVKSFARMLDENVYDKNKKVENKNGNNPVVIDLYNIDTDEGEDDSQRLKESLDDKGDSVNAKTFNSEEKTSGKYDEEIAQTTCPDDEGIEKRSLNKHEQSSNSLENESENKKSSETESEEKKKNVDAVKSKTKSLSVNLMNEKINSSEEENKESAGDEKNVRENKRRLNHNKTKKSDQGENEKSSTRSEETDEENRNKTKNSQKGDAESEEISEQEKRASSDGESVNETRERDSSEENKRISSEEERKNTRKTRNHKKKETKLIASFEKYKRQRERFLNSKEKLQLLTTKEAVKALESSESESDRKDNEQKLEKPKKKRILASSEEESTRETEGSDVENFEKENQNQKSDSEGSKSSSDEISSDNEERNKKARIIKRQRRSGISDSSEDGSLKETKKTRRNSSESSEDEDKKKKKGRKNIKKILKKESLQIETKEALKNEEERKRRLKEKQKLFEELFQQEKKDGSPRQIILDFDPETKEPLVVVHKKLAKKLKPHQVQGVKFMWDNCFESVQKLEEEGGSGCILAHCMGLGKTLQVITLVHTVMTHELGVNTVLVVCPLSTVSNWIREFEMWLGNIHTDPITLYDLVRYKKVEERRFHLEDWHNNGGVLFLSYDLFRNLTKEFVTKKGKKKKSRYQQAFERALLDPGPDLVVCDEGHLLKNEDTALSRSVSRIKTSRRIVLTGTPLQNNLIEYHCMVQFVKPNILGTRKEFSNRFVNPINNGQFEDSTDLDVKIMKRRSHVLHSMLEGCIQRFDYSVLTPFLPEKHEFVLSISLTETQVRAYSHFIKNLSVKSSGSSRAASLFNDYHNLQRIWTHPRTLLMQSERESQKETLQDDSEGSLKEFIVSSDEEMSKSECESSENSDQEVVPRKRILRSNANDPEIKKIIEESESLQEKHWWDEFYDEKAYDDLRESNKLLVLFSLLKYCEEAKDKVLVFSQSLYSLDLIEFFLSKVDENTKKNNEMLGGHQGTWVLGSDYFRLDGSTRSESRAIWCKYFNEESNTRARLFLISTKAGGLGINLYGANRVVIFDASWNPSHDLQSIFRVYRFGQKKTCYIYRFLSEATMEEKIYERQVTKLSLAHRVVDEHQIERHYTMGNLQELYNFEPTPKDQRKIPKLPKDSVLADLLADHKDIIVSYHEHDSLLENKQEEELSEEERKAAWKEYEEEKAQKTFNVDAAMQHQLMLAQQMQFSQGGMEGRTSLNPAYFSQVNASTNFINPMFIQSNIPLEALRRGMQVGVTPLPEESLESYFTRIFSREGWMLTASSENELSQSSISYQVIRRFILSKGFESPFGLQLLANILNEIIQGCKSKQMGFELPMKLKKLNEIPEKPMANVETNFDDSLEMNPISPESKLSFHGANYHGRESCSSEVSDRTILYHMNNSNVTTDDKSRTTDLDLDKEEFFSSESESSNIYNSKEAALVKEKDIMLEEQKNEGKKKRNKSEEGSNAEEEELEKLLRMTEINSKTRSNVSGSEKEKENKEEQKDHKNLKSKREEMSLLDCLDSENCEGSGKSKSSGEEEEKKESDFFTLVNSQVKKTFLVSSDESRQSSEEKEIEKTSEKEKKSPKKITELNRKGVKKKKDDLSEFRIPNLNLEEKEEEEVTLEDEFTEQEISEIESTEKDQIYKEDGESTDQSDESVKCVQHFKNKRRTSAGISEKATDTDSGSDIQQVFCKTESSPTKGRKNIKKILKKESLQVETKQALKMETERKKRVSERQNLFNSLFPNADTDSKLILDFDPQTKEELIVVDENLSQKLKPHQKDGVRFMWNCCFESLKQLEEDSGSGCVLAHCMGLGKTLQVITLVHTILTHNTGVQTVMVICPLNTIRNWTHEFETWQKNCRKKIKPIDLIPCKSMLIRMLKVKSWCRKGGVLVISYEMFRSLIKKDKDSVFSQGFLDPGPDLVVCDEGHVLKNNNSALSKCMSRIKTLRRIILTGTPLQNNLVEYYCMVQFVKPNILGTMKEFKNRFVHPINNGQFEDSTQLDVLLMKRRSHVLHTMLDGFIQRFGYYVLTPFLPEKQEYVISISLTETQEKIYRLFIDRCSQENRGLLKDFHWLQKIWTHPQVLLKHSIKCNSDPDAKDLWGKYVRDEEYNDIRSSGKLYLLFKILRQSKDIGDKVLVFSQSLFSLDLIEYFLRCANHDYFSGIQTEFADTWQFGSDYYRLDGSTNSENRDLFCQKFNNVNDKRFRLFLVSTKAGGLGISLVAANRVVVFDASWNPTHDVQSIFRIYRFGQKKPCFIYRFLAAATMEEKIYKRQVTKLSLAHRILDEHQIERHYTMGNLQELYRYDPIPKNEWRVPKIPKDNLFAEVLGSNRDIIVGYHEHDSLLENKEEEELTEEDRRAAWEDYEKEKLTPEQPLPVLNGAPLPISVLKKIFEFPPTNKVNNEGLKMVQRSQQGYEIPATEQNFDVVPSENQMCRIVDVRTLQGEGNPHAHGRMEIERMLEMAQSFGLKPFEGEPSDRFFRRIEETLKAIFPWKF